MQVCVTRKKYAVPHIDKEKASVLLELPTSPPSYDQASTF